MPGLARADPGVNRPQQLDPPVDVAANHDVVDAAAIDAAALSMAIADRTFQNRKARLQRLFSGPVDAVVMACA